MVRLPLRPRPSCSGKARVVCRCGVCPACVANEAFEEARFARHLDPNYYRRSAGLRWEGSLRGGLAPIVSAGLGG